MTEIVVIVNDTHINSSVGLCPAAMKRDDGQTIVPSSSQLWLRERWLEFWHDVKLAREHFKAEKVNAIVNGDWGDMNKHSAYQLLSPNHDDVIDWMVDVMQPAKIACDRIFVVRGTEAHTGGVGWMENRAAKELGAEIDSNTGLPSWWVYEGTFEGVNILAVHRPRTNSGMPWTRGAAANRQAKIVEDAYYDNDWRPHLAVFGHVHHAEDSFDNHRTRAIYNAPWTCLDAHAQQIGVGLNPVTVCGLIVVCQGGRYQVIKRTYKLPKAKPWAA